MKCFSFHVFGAGEKCAYFVSEHFRTGGEEYSKCTLQKPLRRRGVSIYERSFPSDETLLDTSEQFNELPSFSKQVSSLSRDTKA